jgi:hypothetical protein
MRLSTHMETSYIWDKLGKGFYSSNIKLYYCIIYNIAVRFIVTMLIYVTYVIPPSSIKAQRNSEPAFTEMVRKRNHALAQIIRKIINRLTSHTISPCKYLFQQARPTKQLSNS